MRKIKFTKMVGAGNDFIIVEASKRLSFKSLAQKVCHRTDGIGADGLLVLGPSNKCDYRMRIINADGSEAEMCGNGARCMAAYISREKKRKKATFTIQTLAGTVQAQAKGEVATVTLNPPTAYKEKVSIGIAGRTLTASYIDTGVPHTVIFVEGLKNIDVKKIGRAIRFHKIFSPRGTNVDFVEELSQNFINIRTYERGVESETRACGTGSVAAAIVFYLRSQPLAHKKSKAQIKVLTKSGEALIVSFIYANGLVRDISLKGSARFIANGHYLF